MTNPVCESVFERQARFNRSTQSHWLHFAPHRARVQELILTGRELTPGGRFCALGAGNCNDLELNRLVESFDEVHLVDIDSAALSAAALRQGVEGNPRLRLHAPVDLTGIAEIVSGWRIKKPSIEEVRTAVAVSDAAASPELGVKFDVVLSSCVLSQIAGYATDSLGGDSHPGFRELVRAIRARHLRLMLDLLTPGGTGLLVCDLVSSDSASELPRVPEHDLARLVNKLAREGNFFSGLFPDAVLAACENDRSIATRVADLRLLAPWLWRLGARRTFLVYAIRFRRASPGAILSTGYPLRGVR